jgi:hypothetical protein
MSEVTVTEVEVNYEMGGKVQIVKFEYQEEYHVGRAQTYSGRWTEEEAKAFHAEKLDEYRQEVGAEAQAEVDRLMKLRDETNA